MQIPRHASLQRLPLSPGSSSISRFLQCRHFHHLRPLTFFSSSEINACSRGAGSPLSNSNSRRSYSSTAASFKASPAPAPAPSTEGAPTSMSAKQQQKLLAQQYNNRRAKYKRAVTKLRHRYALEIQKQTKLDEESKQKQQAIITRKKLERQRLKNIQSAKNAMKQEQFRIAQARKFEEHLKQQAVKRTEREARFHKARALVVAEMEEQAKHWMTTPEEVDAVLCNRQNHFIEQQLWTRPGSFVGEPAPSNDSSFWKYESHTWKIRSTYPLKRDKLLEEIQEIAYDQSNVDYKVYWDDEKIQHQVQLEEKAKLRALVLAAGKKSLLLKQKQLMQDAHAQQKRLNDEEGILPPKLDLPVPSTDILANHEAMEREGVKILKEDPTQFFVFANQQDGNSSARDTDEDANNGDKNTSAKSTTTDLGKPIRLVDPVRDGSFTNTPFPEIIGRLPKADLRTEREKKKQEREERMLAAAAAAASGDKDKKQGDDLELEDDISFGGGIHEENADYLKLANTPDEEDLEWEKGLDSIEDRELLDTPYSERYSEEDIEWTIAQLEKKIENLKEIIASEGGKEAVKDLDALQFGSSHLKRSKKGEEISASVDDENDDVLKAMGPGTVKSIKVDEKGREFVSYDVVDDGENQESSTSEHEDEEIDDFLTALERNELDDLIRIQDTQNVLKTLTEEQISALQTLGDEDSEGLKSADEIRDTLSATIPGLSESQLKLLVDLELSLRDNADVQKKLQRS